MNPPDPRYLALAPAPTEPIGESPPDDSTFEAMCLAAWMTEQLTAPCVDVHDAESFAAHLRPALIEALERGTSPAYANAAGNVAILVVAPWLDPADVFALVDGLSETRPPCTISEGLDGQPTLRTA